MTEYISHAELDKAMYDLDLSENGLDAMRSERAAIAQLRRENADSAHERAVERKNNEALGAAAMRRFLREERGLDPYDPTAAFRRQLAEDDEAKRQLAEAGRVDTLNAGLMREIEEVKDDSGDIDISKLNPDSLVRYKASLDVLLGENASDYDKRMQGVFGTPDYMDVIAELVDEAEADRLMRIAKYNPGANPLGDMLLKRRESLETPDSV